MKMMVNSMNGYRRNQTINYTSPDIQNDLIAILAFRVLRSITTLLQESPYLAVMNEKTDVHKSGASCHCDS